MWYKKNTPGQRGSDSCFSWVHRSGPKYEYARFRFLIRVLWWKISLIKGACLGFRYPIW